MKSQDNDGRPARRRFAGCYPTSFAGRLTLALVLLEATVITAIEATIGALYIGNLRQQGQNPFDPSYGRGIPVYVFIFIFAMGWLIWAGFDAIRHQNTIQLIGFVLFNFCCLAYSVFQYFQLTDDTDQPMLEALLIAIPLIVGIVGFAYVVLSMKLYMEFGWKIYKRIGADVKMKEMYRSYQIFLTLLKVDIFFFFGFSVQFLALVLHTADVEFSITIIGLVVSCVSLLLAVYAVRRESKNLMTSFILFLLVGMGYFVFKIARMYTRSQEHKYHHTRKFLTFFAALSLCVVMATLFWSATCYRNFGRGLRRFIDRSTEDMQKQNLGFFTVARNNDGNAGGGVSESHTVRGSIARDVSSTLRSAPVPPSGVGTPEVVPAEQAGGSTPGPGPRPRQSGAE